MSLQALVGLQADHQPVGHAVATTVTEQRVRDFAEIDHHFGEPLLHALAGAQVERDAGPAPVVELGLDRDEGLGTAVGGIPGSSR